MASLMDALNETPIINTAPSELKKFKKGDKVYIISSRYEKNWSKYGEFAYSYYKNHTAPNYVTISGDITSRGMYPLYEGFNVFHYDIMSYNEFNNAMKKSDLSTFDCSAYKIKKYFPSTLKDIFSQLKNSDSIASIRAINVSISDYMLEIKSQANTCNHYVKTLLKNNSFIRKYNIVKTDIPTVLAREINNTISNINNCKTNIKNYFNTIKKYRVQIAKLEKSIKELDDKNFGKKEIDLIKKMLANGTLYKVIVNEFYIEFIFNDILLEMKSTPTCKIKKGASCFTCSTNTPNAIYYLGKIGFVVHNCKEFSKKYGDHVCNHMAFKSYSYNDNKNLSLHINRGESFYQGSICFGGFDELIRNNLKTADLAGLLNNINAYLNSYNIHSPLVPLESLTPKIIKRDGQWCLDNINDKILTELGKEFIDKLRKKHKTKPARKIEQREPVSTGLSSGLVDDTDDDDHDGDDSI